MPGFMCWSLPLSGHTVEAIAYALSVANGDAVSSAVDTLQGREIIDVEYEEINSTNEYDTTTDH